MFLISDRNFLKISCITKVNLNTPPVRCIAVKRNACVQFRQLKQVKFMKWVNFKLNVKTIIDKLSFIRCILNIELKIQGNYFFIINNVHWTFSQAVGTRHQFLQVFLGSIL